MEFSWHPDKRLVIVSLWTGSTCRATFQLPIEEVPAVIGGLAESLGEAASAGTAPVEAGRLASFAERVRVRFRREPAQVLRLVKREARRPSR